MGRLWAVIGAAVLSTAVLAGCAPTNLTYQGQPHPAVPPARPAYRPPAPAAAAAPPKPEPLVSPANLAGWATEDHAAALAAFQAGCGVSQETAMRLACARGRSLGHADEAVARAFFEQNFRAMVLSGPGVLTGYFAPEYPARSAPDADFSAAVRPRPTDMMVSPPGPDDPPGKKLVRQVGDGGESWSYPDRAGIELTPATDAVAYMRPEDLFFLQIQGSGILDFPDGVRERATYAGDNGRPFVAIAPAMVRRGLLPADQASATSIRTWLRNHRAEAQAVMDLDPRYVFFSLQPDDGSEPAGAAGVHLTAGRSVAVDPNHHSYGELDWIDATAPVLAGAPRTYRRLVMALDTGSAIKGMARADLYFGRGEAAGLEAGRVRHTLLLFRLVPIGATP
jgi:membrane-bound lytic murein transglycosylase A